MLVAAENAPLAYVAVYLATWYILQHVIRGDKAYMMFEVASIRLSVSDLNMTSVTPRLT